MIKSSIYPPVMEKTRFPLPLLLLCFQKLGKSRSSRVCCPWQWPWKGVLASGGSSVGGITSEAQRQHRSSLPSGRQFPGDTGFHPQVGGAQRSWETPGRICVESRDFYSGSRPGRCAFLAVLGALWGLGQPWRLPSGPRSPKASVPFPAPPCPPPLGFSLSHLFLFICSMCLRQTNSLIWESHWIRASLHRYKDDPSRCSTHEYKATRGVFMRHSKTWNVLEMLVSYCFLRMANICFCYQGYTPVWTLEHQSMVKVTKELNECIFLKTGFCTHRLSRIKLILDRCQVLTI